jgi:hypothetical protein
MTIYLATVLSASENAQIRNGHEASVLAERMVKLTGGQAGALDALAMACAETGQFEEAVQIQQQAVTLVTAAGSAEAAALLQKRLQLYLVRQPWRQSFKKAKSDR